MERAALPAIGLSVAVGLVPVVLLLVSGRQREWVLTQGRWDDLVFRNS